MENNGFTTYILLIPIMALVGIPLIALIVISIARILQRIYSMINTVQEHTEETEAESEQRRDKRIDTDMLLVSIVGDGGKITGTTCNISNSGICIKDLPTEKLFNSDQFTATVNTGYQTFTIDLVRKWDQIHDNAKTMGAAITNAPDNWIAFVATERQFS